MIVAGNWCNKLAAAPPSMKRSYLVHRVDAILEHLLGEGNARAPDEEEQAHEQPHKQEDDTGPDLHNLHADRLGTAFVVPA